MDCRASHAPLRVGGWVDKLCSGDWPRVGAPRRAMPGATRTNLNCSRRARTATLESPLCRPRIHACGLGSKRAPGEEVSSGEMRIEPPLDIYAV